MMDTSQVSGSWPPGAWGELLSGVVVWHWPVVL